MFKNKKMFKKSLFTLRSLVIFGIALTVLGSSIAVYADRYDAEINTLRVQNNNTQGEVNSLQVQAANYQDAMSKLQDQINVMQASLHANQAKQADLQAQIEAAKAKITQQKAYLGEDIKAMYVDGGLSTIEQLASSNNLSDYIDKEEYRTSVQNKVDSMIKEIAALQARMQSQKQEVDVLVKEQQKQRDSLAGAHSQQQAMLSYNEDQQGAYNSKISGNNSKIAELKRQQAAELARNYGTSAGGTVGGGSYPWGNAVCLHTGNIEGQCYDYNWAINGNIGNPVTGYDYRNCTDYVAWKAGAPRGLGNANTWAQRSPTGWDYSPNSGDAAVDEGGYYGHVMYVESASGDSVFVSDYNRAGPGEYGTMTLTKVSDDGAYRSETGHIRYLKFVTF